MTKVQTWSQTNDDLRHHRCHREEQKIYHFVWQTDHTMHQIGCLNLDDDQIPMLSIMRKDEQTSDNIPQDTAQMERHSEREEKKRQSHLSISKKCEQDAVYTNQRDKKKSPGKGQAQQGCRHHQDKHSQSWEE